jgi:PAS domain S-box-containing protein
MTGYGKGKRGLVEELRELRTHLGRLEQRNAELMQIQEMLQESVNQFKTIFDNTLVGLYRTAPDGRVLMANPALLKMLGYSSFAQLARRNLEQGAYEPQYLRSSFKERIESEGKIVGLESAWKKSDGTTVYVRESAQAVRDESGDILYYQGTVEDITERKQAEEALHTARDVLETRVQQRTAELQRANEALRQSENRYRTVIDHAGEGIVVVQDGKLRLVNWRHTLVTGRSQEESMSRPFTEFVHPDDRKRVADIYAARLRGEPVGFYEFRIIDKEGQTKWLENNGVVIEWDGKPASLNFLRDITERKKTQEELREREEMIRALVETSRDWIWSIDVNGVHTYCNPAVEQILGYSADELVGRLSLDLIHDDDRRMIKAYLPICIAEKRGWSNLLLRWRHKDGTYRYLESNAVPILSSENTLIGFRGVDRDITERKLAQESLRETTALLETIFAHTHFLVAYLDPQFNFVRVNRAYAEADRREPSFFVGQNHFDLYPNTENEAIFRKVVEKGMPYFAHAKPFEYAGHPERGVTYWDWSLMPIKQQEGAVCGLVLTLADVTEQRRAEQTLREREATLTSIFRTAPVGIGLERDRVLVRVNDQVCSMLGYSREELVGRCAVMFYPTEDHYECVRQENRPQILEKGAATVETQWKRKDGRIIDVLLSTTVFDPADFAKGVTFIALDITERKAAEEAVRESEEKFRSLADQSPNMIFINKKGRIVYANRRCEEIMGYTREEFYSPDFDFLTLFAPESVDAIKGYFTRHLRGQEVESYDSCLVSRTGQRIEAISTCKLIQYEGEAAILGIVTDITERKKAEQALCESQERLKILFELAPDAIYVMDLEGRFVDGNKAAEELVGFTKTELIGKSLAESGLLSTEDLLRAAMNLRKTGDGWLPGPTEYTLRRKNGSLVDVEVRTFHVRIGGKTLSLGIARDITERKQAQQRLLDDREQLKSGVSIVAHGGTRATSPGHGAARPHRSVSRDLQDQAGPDAQVRVGRRADRSPQGRISLS